MELVLKINSVSGDHIHYQDGDVIEAFSNVRIHFCHAEMICHPDNFSFNTVGLRDRDTLLEKFMAKTSKYRFTRVSNTDVERLNLLTDEMDVINATPNAENEYINASQFVNRRIEHPRHKVFGTEQGKEVWYGGNSVRDSVTIDAVWNDIETHTANLKTDNASWPLSPIEKMTCLAVNCVGFKNSVVQDVSNGTASLRRETVYTIPEDPEEEPVMIAKRQWQIPYWDLAAEFSIDIDEVRNKSKTVDARSSAPLEDRNHMDDIHVDKVAEGIISV
jgi:hypothetical protein